jgi:protein TonB
MLAQFYARRATAMHAMAQAAQPKPTQKFGEPDDRGIYRVGGAVTPPHRLDRPVYPPEALAAGIEGAVVADVVISGTGQVIEAKILQSIPLLDEAALEAVRNWHFAPTIVNAHAVPVRMTVTVNFTKP